MGLLTNFKQNDVFRDEHSLAFDGSNDYVELSGAFNYTVHSISIWVKEASISGASSLFDYRDANNDGIHIYLADGKPLYQNNNADGYYNSALTLNQWHHIVCTNDGSTSTIYVNGVAVETADTSGETISVGASTVARIGCRSHTSPDNYFNGNISEVAFYTSALTINQVKTIYNGREPYNHKEGVASGNLQAWYRMGDATDFAKDYGFIIPDQMSRGINTIKSWDFSSDVDGWTGYSGNTLEHSTAITNHLGGSGVVKCINADNGDKFIGGRSSALTDSDPGIEANKHYLIEYYLYVPTSWSGTTNIRLQEASMSGKTYANDVVLIDYSVKDSWQYGSNIFSPTSGDLGGFIYLQAIATTNFEADDFVYLSGVTLKEIDSKNGKMTNMDITDIEGDTP